MFQHPNMFYKYVRPMPHRGVAAELRCMDKQNTLRELSALMCLAKGIVRMTSYLDLAFDAGKSEVSSQGMVYHLKENTTIRDIQTDCSQARITGSAALNKATPLLRTVKGFLDYGEQDYLEVLVQRLSQGNPAHMLRRSMPGFSLDALHRKQIDRLRKEVGLTALYQG